jgi:hypothetical protein
MGTFRRTSRITALEHLDDLGRRLEEIARALDTINGALQEMVAADDPAATKCRPAIQTRRRSKHAAL